MPIEVRHDVPIAASAGLAALAGTAQARIREREEEDVRGRLAMQLDAAAQRQHMQIQAAAEGQQQQIEAASARQHDAAEYTKDRIGYEVGLREELEEQKFQQEMEGMEQRARSEAEQWEWKLDTVAKKKQNEYKRVLTQLNDAEAMSQAGFDEREVAALKQQVWAGLNSVELTPSMKEPQWDSNLPDQFKGGMPGEVPGGIYGHFTPNRTTGVAEFHQLDPAKTLEYLREKAEQERIDKRREKRDAERVKLMTTEFQPMREAKVVPWGRDIKAGPEGPKRLRTREEAEIILEDIYGPDPDAVPKDILGPAEIPGPPPPPPPKEVPEILISSAQSEKVNLTEAEQGLPASVAWAQAYMRAIMRRTDAGERIPNYLQEAVQVSNEILRNYRAQEGL